MTRQDGPTASADSGQVDGVGADRVSATRRGRQRAAELFGAHRYRDLQKAMFERRRGASEQAVQDWDEASEEVLDDEVDPPLDGPADAAWAEAESDERHLLDPVPAREYPADAVETEPFDAAGVEPGERDTEVFDAVFTDGDTVLEPPTTAAPGRNMVAATAVGVALLGAVVASAWWHPIAFAIFIYAFTMGAVIEFSRALGAHGRRVPLIPVLAATAGLGVATWYGGPETLVVAMLVGSAGVVAWRIGEERIENTLADSLAGVLALLWIPFLASFLFLMELADMGWQRVLIVVLAVVGNDTGGLLFGSLFGKHKLLPRVSPGKTWEGAAGGVLLGTAAAAGAAWAFFDGRWYIGAVVGAAAAIAAIVGDLAESALKRDIKIKDMSSFLPGHGGILDRIDSILFAAPVAYVAFAFFLGTLGTL